MDYAKNCENLPQGYKKIREINLKENKKELLAVSLLSVGIAVIVMALGFVFCPLDRFVAYVINGDGWVVGGVFATVIIGMIVYIILHELVHGICFKAFSGKKPQYGFNFMYAYAKSDYYYNKRDYSVIGLSPVVLFFMLFTILNAILPLEWFWPIYLLQVANLSGAAGDFYVSALLLAQKRSLLIYDTGYGMIFYDYDYTAKIESKENENNVDNLDNEQEK